MDRRRALLLLACCAVLARAGAALAQTPPARGDTIRIGYKATSIATVVSELARATGVTLIYDEKLRELGNVTIEGPPQVSREEALAMIDSLLLLRGFAAVPGPGGARKVMAISGAPAPWTPDGRLPDTDAPVTTLVRLQHANAADLLPVLTPYLGSNSTASAFGPSNALILSGPASLMRTLRIAIDALDREQAGPPLIWPMRVARAEVVAEQLREVVDEIDVPFVSSDERRNALLLRVRPGETEEIRELVDGLDRPARGAGGIEVVKLRYADPEELVEQLESLRSDTAADAKGAARRAGLRGLSFEVVADLPTHSIVLRGPPETVDAVLDVVGELDRVPPTVRVVITVATVELDDTLTLGIDYLIPSLANTKGPKDLVAAAFVNPSGGGFSDVAPAPSTELPFVATFTREPLLIPIIGPTGESILLEIPEGGSITMNKRIVDSEVLLRPTLMITSGHEHEIFAGDNVPIPVAAGDGTGSTGFGTTTGTGTTGTGTGGAESGGAAESASANTLGNAAPEDESGTGGTGGGSTGSGNALTVRQNIERKDVGTTLRVTPTVGEQGGVMLELRIEVSQLAESVAGPVEEVGPTIRDTTIESTIRLDSGETAVIATAARPLTQRTRVGVPWLMDVPVLGWAFRTTTEQQRKHHLIVAARAEILHPESRDLANRLVRELQVAAGAEQR